MAFSGGTFSRTFDCTTDRDNGVKILASKFDTELDGMATGLSTCILKDGTQTCTAAIPFAQGITLPDDKTIAFGTNSDVLIQYDETTTDSLKISAAEGAGLAITLMADEGDDAGDEWKLNIADGGTLTLGNDINSAGTYVTHLTITPNATVANSTMAVAGNLTVGGALTLGSGAVISEAELETIDGITPGTVLASKAMVVDSDKDITGGRNLTITGELDAATLDISGNADIDGTLETDALSIASTLVTATAAELNYNDTGAAVGTVVASKTVTVDANKDVASFRNITLTGELDAGSLDVSGNADIDGTLEADAMTLNGTAITATATLDTGISNNNVPKFTSGAADNDFLRIDGTAIEGRSAAEVLSDIAAAPAAGSSNIVTTGALNSGSITSGFGAIDNGSSAITTTGTVTGGSVAVDNITIDGTEIDLSSGDLTVDVAGDINLDADGGEINFQDGGTTIAYLSNSSTDLLLGVNTSDKDLYIQGNDGGSTINALHLDMSAAGLATFNAGGSFASTLSAPSVFGKTDTDTGIAFDNGTNIMQFYTANTERVRIEAGGNFLVGTASSTGNGAIGQFKRSANGAAGYFETLNNAGVSQNVVDIVSATNAAFTPIRFWVNGYGTTLVGSISTTTSSTSYNTSSDYRLKTAVEYDWDATSRLKQLKPARFKWIVDGDDAVFVDGFLAHEVESIIPESISGNGKDAMRDEEYEVSAAEVDADGNVTKEAVMGTRSVPDYQGIDQSKLTPLLTKALIESVAKIEALEARITALEAG